MNEHATRLLDAACVAAQRLEKRLRRLRNQGGCTDQDVADAKEALALLRDIHDRHGLAPTDIDSRGERRKK